MTKLCIKCNTEQPIENFLKEKTKNGYGNRCKTCVGKYLKEYHEKNKERLSEQKKQYYEKNKQSFLDRSKRTREKNPEKTAQYQKEYRIRNREKLNKYIVNRLHTDAGFKLKHTLRGKLRKLLNGTNKTNSALYYLGCTIDFFKGYLEAKFCKGMTWENYGTLWHIDHIIPCRAFDLTKEEDRCKCLHYSNLQPLLAIDNLKKLDILPSRKYARYSNTTQKRLGED
jgi:hypothetical protein